MPLHLLAAASWVNDGAVRLYKALIESHPTHFAGWFNCGVAPQKTGAVFRKQPMRIPGRYP